MRDESHLDDMRSAIRGDFERLAERRGGQELMRPELEPEPEREPALEPEITVERLPEPELELEVAPPEPLAEPAHDLPEPRPGELPRKGFLDRLLGR